MEIPSGSDILLSPWSSVSRLAQLFMLLQLAAVLLVCVRFQRSVLDNSHILRAMAVTTPMWWLLFEIEFGLVMWCEVSHGFDRFDFVVWLLKSVIAIGATFCLQGLLMCPRSDLRPRTVPWFGLVVGLAAVFADAVFLIVATTPTE